MTVAPAWRPEGLPPLRPLPCLLADQERKPDTMTTAPNDSTTPGQAAYEAEIAARPLYDHGAPRPQWDALAAEIRQQWETYAAPPRDRRTIALVDIDTDRAAALDLLRSGKVTLAEMAALLGITRQAVQEWARRHDVDAVTARRLYLKRLWSRARRKPP